MICNVLMNMELKTEELSNDCLLSSYRIYIFWYVCDVRQVQKEWWLPLHVGHCHYKFCATVETPAVLEICKSK